MKKTSLLLLFILVSCVLQAQAQVADTPMPAGSSPEAIHGNWFDSKRGGWAVGIYDSVAIVDNSIYDIRHVHRYGKDFELELQDRENGRRQMLKMTPQGNGACTMKQGKSQRRLTSSYRQPAVTADKGYGDFFCPDTAVIQGYIGGYDTALGFETGVVYLNDVITNTDTPLAVPVAPDGTFACKLPMKYPTVLYMVFNNSGFLFFAEPGKTQTVYIDAKDIVAQRQPLNNDNRLLLMGEGAHLSCLAAELSDKVFYYDAELMRTALEQTPAQFRESFRSVVSQWTHVGDSLASVYGASQKAVSMIHHTVKLVEYRKFFRFLQLRGYMYDQHPDNRALKAKVEDDYYDFMHDMPLDDPEVLACYGSDHLLADFWSIGPLWNVKRFGYSYTSSMTPKERDDRNLAHKAMQQAKMDSIVERISGKESPFVWQMACVRDVNSELWELHTQEAKRKYVDGVKEKVKGYPFLAGQVEQVYASHMARLRSGSYALPEGKAGDIFRNIIKDHAGKVLFVDFWATTCGPCRAGIAATAELRRKYKDHPDFRFVYITAANESPRADYDRYVEENIKGEATYYLSATDFAYLRQLFKFNGIPHYVLVEPDGTISIEEIGTWNLRNYLQEHFPLREN